MNVPWTDDRDVAVVRDEPRYATRPPFHPSEAYPEWEGTAVGEEDNPAYRAVRECFRVIGWDAARAGTSAWNPLGEIVKPGNTVLLKPNLVSHRNMGERAYGLTDTDCLVTHGSVIRAVVDYVALALQGRGRIIIGDCPVQGTDWSALVRLVGLDALQAQVAERFPGIELVVEDFRLGRAKIVRDRMVSRAVDEDRRSEYREVDLGTESLLMPLMQGPYAFGVAQYPRHRMRRAHTPTTNLYLFPRAFLEADVVVNLPKLKSHMKSGVTCALKNFVGVNGHKDYLPHFRFGSPRRGGDEYPPCNMLAETMWSLLHADWEHDRGLRKAAYFYAARACSALLQLLFRYPKGYMSVGGGSWYGNDTLWRTVLDINRAFLYWSREGEGLATDLPRERQYLAIIDGLVGGHRESPLAPTPYESGVMLCARNPVAIDAAATAIMGFDWKRIPQVANGFGGFSYPLARFTYEDVRIHGLKEITRVDDVYASGTYCEFEPSMGYRGHIEYGERSGERMTASDVEADFPSA